MPRVFSSSLTDNLSKKTNVKNVNHRHEEGVNPE